MGGLLSRALSAAALAATLLAGCGGGDSPDLVSGTAATGAAIAGGTVTLKCVSGTPSAAATGSDGSFTVDVSSATLPCVARVDYTDGAGAPQRLHTLVTAIGTANITPITELLLTSLTGAAAAGAFDQFDATALKALTPAQITAAVAAVKAYLSNVLGVDTTNLPDDPIGTRFVAKVGSVDGDKIDKVLDDIKAKLAIAGKTLGDALSEIANGGGGGAAGDLTVSAASDSAKNGTYAPAGAKFTNGADAGFNGQTVDGKFELEVVWAANGTIKRAHVWFFGANNTINFFGCDAQGIPCTGVAYNLVSEQLSFTNVMWNEVNPSLDGSNPDALINGGESLTVNGTLSVK